MPTDTKQPTIAKRIFKFNGTTLPDIEIHDPKEVIAIHAAGNPHLTNSHVTGPEPDANGDLVYTVKSSELGTKG
jgi:PRTRC genetic system protein C